MRDGSNITHEANLEAGVVDSAHSSLTAGTGALHKDSHGAHAMILSRACSTFSSNLGGEGSALARTLEAASARGGPADHVAFQIGEGNDGIVEGRLDVGDAHRNVLLFLLLPGATGSGHSRMSPYSKVLLPPPLGTDGQMLLLFPTHDGTPGALAGTSVGVGALAMDGESPARQAAAVTQTPIAGDIHQSLDVGLNLTAKVAFDLVVLFDLLADLVGFLSGEVVRRFGPFDAGGVENLQSGGPSDASFFITILNGFLIFTST